MGKDSKIAWTNSTFNPWIGCQRVSPGCENCYAEARDVRFTGGARWGVKGERVRTSLSNWHQPIKWNREAKEAGVRARVFCASLADVFEDRPELAPWRADLFRLIEATPHLDWLLLTKRPENMRRLAEAAGWAGEWPGHVWAGTTVEDQRRANERIPHLLAVPATVRFLSCEPLLEPVNFMSVLIAEKLKLGAPKSLRPEAFPVPAWLDWVIVGGESGHAARSFDLGWARNLVAQCKAAGVAVFVKQLGSRPIGTCGRCRGDGIDPVRVDHDPEFCSECGGAAPTTEPALVKLAHRKGEDLAEWPADLRVQEFPKGGTP